MTSLTALPHSTAAVERVFSKVNYTKTSRSNRMTTESVKNRILARQLVNRGGSCTTWTPSNELVRDAGDGACYRRYQKRLEEYKAEGTIHVEQLNLD